MLKPIKEAVQPITVSNTSSNTTTPSMSGNTAAQNLETNTMKSKINSIVSEADNLVTALEHVGAMYGIPSTHIIADDTANGITVKDDYIIAPPVSARNQTKPIVQAVGSVLDYISQRIDDKLNDYQMNNIEQGKKMEIMKYDSNPNKGKCIGVYDDDEGGKILAYDTGLVDMPHTDAARRKVDELRASNTIPTFDPNANIKTPDQSYFNDEDDNITNGIDMDASNNAPADQIDLSENTNDVADQIQESAYHVKMCAKYGDTTHLGYDLFRKYGFDYIKPVDSVVMESTEETTEKKKKHVKATDIKFMKFDNKNILKAVDCFNAARENQDNTKKMNLDQFINDPETKKGIKYLNDQFDCSINLRFYNTKSKSSRNENAFTQIFNDLKRKMTISKSKGFQLGGLPIDIFVVDHMFESMEPNTELFGQTMVAVILHEIFHNISAVMRYSAATMGLSITMTLNLIANAKTAKEKRIIATNYVDTIDELSDNKFMTKMVKKKLVKQILAVSAVEGNEKAERSVTGDEADETIDRMIKLYKKMNRDARPNKIKYAFIGTMVVGGTIAGIVSGIGIPSAIAMGGGILMMFNYAIISDLTYLSFMKAYENMKIYEEYYCDLFAGMYKLPIVFFMGPSSKKFTPNDFKVEKLNELAMLESDLQKALFSRYPSLSERNRASVKIASDLLKTKDLEPQVKKYCQWIVDNFSNLEKTDIDRIYNKTTFNPKEAADLDKHIDDLIRNNNITLTESFKQWVNSNDEIF